MAFNRVILCCVQHLTTFVLDRKDGMITVDDGIRRLRLLDAKGKIWTQEMLLQVEEKSVSLIDLETKVRPSRWFFPGPGPTPPSAARTLSDVSQPLFLQNELENFPIGTVQHCQAMMNACSYDSILALVCKESGQTKPDLHLFQCDDIKVNCLRSASLCNKDKNDLKAERLIKC